MKIKVGVEWSQSPALVLLLTKYYKLAYFYKFLAAGFKFIPKAYFSVVKGTVQRDLRGVKSGIN